MCAINAVAYLPPRPIRKPYPYTMNLNISLKPVDWVIVILYLGLLWGVGLWVSYSHRKQASDFMLNRHYSWFNIGSSIFATNIGPSFLLGQAAAAYAAGMATANFEWFAFIFLFLLGMICAPFYIRMRITTLPEYIRRRFGKGAGDFLSFYGLFTVVIMWIGANLFVGGKMMHQILPAYPEWACICALSLVFMTFTVAGGFAAVMVTDTVQAILMIGSMLALNIFAFKDIGSIHNLMDKVPGEFWQLFRPATDIKYPWPALVLGYPIIGFWFWCTDQTIVQRMLGARDLKQAQLGTIYTSFLKILPPFLFLMPGIFCLVLMPHLDDPDKAFTSMLGKFMPVGMLGLMIAVLFAATVAGVAGGLNAFSTIFTMDIYKPKLNPKASDLHLKVVSQVSIVVVTILSIGAALLMQHSKQNIFDTLQGFISYFAPPMAAVFLMSLIWKRVTATAVKTTLFVGTPVCLTVGYLNLNKLLPESPWTHYMMLTFYMFSFCMFLLVAVSLLTQHSSYELSLEEANAGAKGSLDNQGAGRMGRMLWVALAAVMVALYVGFQCLSTQMQSAELYVSAGYESPDKKINIPRGSDSNPGSAREPFLTMERARAEVLKRKAESGLPEGGIKVWVHGGVYPSDTPLVWKDEETGQAGSPIVWRAFPGESPVASCEKKPEADK